MTKRLRRTEKTRETNPLAKSPMIFLLLVKVMVGMTAKGSMRDMRQLSRSFMPESWLISS